MVDKQSFMDTVHAVSEIARVNEGPLSKEEVLSYFEGMELSKEQEAMVYEYFLKADRSDAGAEAESLAQTKEQMDAENAFLNAPYVKLYLEDIKDIEILEEERMIPYYKALLEGDTDAKSYIIHNMLKDVVDIAKRYVQLEVNMSDVLQEGNIGLLMAVEQLLGCNEKVDVREYLLDAIQKAMEDFIDDTLEDDNWENAVVGRARLLNEAKEALTKEMLRTPTMEELSDYTKLSVDEISDIMALTKEKPQK